MFSYVFIIMGTAVCLNTILSVFFPPLSSMLFRDYMVLNEKRILEKAFYLADRDLVLFAHPGWWTTHNVVVMSKATQWW